MDKCRPYPVKIGYLINLSRWNLYEGVCFWFFFKKKKLYTYFFYLKYVLKNLYVITISFMKKIKNNKKLLETFWKYFFLEILKIL